MKNNKNLSLFLETVRNYYEYAKQDELYFYSDEAKNNRMRLIGLLKETEDDLNNILGDNGKIEINNKTHVNILTTALSDDYKSALYCL